MKRIATIFLLAGLLHVAPIPAADFRPSQAIPTTPQVPVPTMENSGSMPIGQPAPTGLAMAPGSAYAAPGCSTCATSKGSKCERFKAWLCFYPAKGEMLPLLNPHPYVGPVMGIYPCTASAGGTCGGASVGCAGSDSENSVGKGPRTGPAWATKDSKDAQDPSHTGFAARLGAILPPRGCKGGCVPPSEAALPGYRFAGAESPAVTGQTSMPPLPTGYSGLKSTQPVRPAANQQAADPLTQPLTRP
jgi:hypothetical protein